MPGTIFGHPFDEELFLSYIDEPDTVLTNLFTSGVVQNNPGLADKFGTEGNFAVIPFYTPLTGNALNYDGTVNNTPVSTSAGFQGAHAFGRMKAWYSNDFTAELSGADPIGSIGRKVGGFWNKHIQNRLISVLEAAAVSAGANHEHDIGSANLVVTDDNRINVDTLLLAAQKACGDMKDNFAIAMMHSAVATRLEQLQILQYLKYVDGAGVQASSKVARIGDMLIFVNDSMTVIPAGVEAAKYTTIIAGQGAIQYTPARCDNPVETKRDPETRGGVDNLYTKKRMVLHPNGFEFVIANIAGKSATDVELAASANYTLKFNEKNIPIARILTNV